MKKIKNLSHLLCLLYLCLLFWVAITFVGHFELSTFGMDSGSYLLMAQFFSPYQDASLAVINSFHKVTYPPIFSVVLALFGGAYNFVIAHSIVAGCFILSLYLFYHITFLLTKQSSLCLLLTILVSILPYCWLYMLPIMSESLYMLLTLSVVFFYEKANISSKKFPFFVIALLLLSILLTRTIGISVLLAYTLVSCVKFRHDLKSLSTVFFSIVGIIFVYWTWKTIHYIDIPDYQSYLSVFIEIYQKLFSDNINTIFHYLTNSGIDVAISWLKVFLLFEESRYTFNFSSLLIISLGCIALIGWIHRLFYWKLDAWYLLFYFIIILLWPYPGHIKRFLYPLIPFFFINIIWVYQILRNYISIKPLKLLLAIFYIAILIVIQPVLWTFFERATDEDTSLVRMFDWYRFKNVNHAKNSARFHSFTLQDRQAIKNNTNEEDIILWVKAHYFSVLTDRLFKNTPESTDPYFLSKVYFSEANYVLITNLTTINNRDGILAMNAFNRFSSLVWHHINKNNAQQGNMLFAINREKLSTLLDLTTPENKNTSQGHLRLIQMMTR